MSGNRVDRRVVHLCNLWSNDTKLKVAMARSSQSGWCEETLDRHLSADVEVKCVSGSVRACLERSKGSGARIFYFRSCEKSGDCHMPSDSEVKMAFRGAQVRYASL